MTKTKPNLTSDRATFAVVRDVNCVGGPASEMAKSFDKEFPKNACAFQAEFELGNVEPAKLFMFDQGDNTRPRFIFNLPTKIHWKATTKLDCLTKGIDAILEACIHRRVDLLEIRKFDEVPNSIGWEQIKIAFLTSFSRVPDIRLNFVEDHDQPMPKQVTIFTDGGAEPNPGVGGYGVVLRFGDSKRELSQGFLQTSNNRMELLAAIVSLETLTEPCSVRLFSDSRYVVDSVSTGAVFRWRENNWKNGKAKNADLWERFVLAFARHNVEMVWVKGHSGIADNERCDELASQAISSSCLSVDEGFVKSETKNGKAKQPKKQKVPKGSAVQALPSNDRPNRGPKPKNIGDPCRHCATPLVRRETKKSNPNSKYYYRWHLHCPGCDRLFHVEEAKVYRTTTNSKS